MNLKTYLGKAAEVLRSSERMVQRNIEIWREEPGSKYYDPDWDVHLDQDEIAGLIRNLSDAANLFDLLATDAGVAARLFKAHVDALDGTPDETEGGA